MLLPLDLLPRIRPLPGEFFVVRHSEPHMYGGAVWVPPSVRTKRRPPFATVVSVSPEVDGLAPGEVLAIVPSVMNRIDFVDGRTRRSLYVCRPAQVVAKVIDIDEADFSERGVHPHGRYGTVDDPNAARVAEGRAEHGVTK